MQNESAQTSLLTLAQRIMRPWRPAASVLVSVFALTTAAIFFLPNRYQTHLKVLVKSERANPATNFDKQTQPILPFEVTEAQINTEIQLMTSTDVLRQVVGRCHLADLLPHRQSQARREEAALRLLQKDLVAIPVHSSNVIDASYEDSDPNRGAEVLRTLSEVFLASHRALRSTPQSYEAFQRISNDYAKRLADAETALARFAQEHRIVTLPEQKSLALTNIARLEAQVQDGTAAQQKSRQIASHLKQDIERLPSSVERQRRSIPNQVAIDQLTASMLTLENKRAAAILRYQPQDRVVQEIDTQIARTRASLTEAQSHNAEEVSTGADPAIDSARGEYLHVAADEAGDQAQNRELTRQLASNRARLSILNAQTTTYHDLQRNVASMEELADSSRRAAETASMAQQFDRENLSNLVVVEQPYPLSLPTSPKRGLLLMLDLLWSLALSVVTACVLEVLADRIHSPFELAAASGVPVLASIPHATAPPASDGSFPALFLAMQRQPEHDLRRIA